ncbi:sigma-54-dependent Fis family transcriptional regulator [Oceanospirillum sediminis]|uniref:Sigma-54-dependent Fis family transcriptional regulator n=1 Tax=Oceanospirillum sediminis TaxID=2760088 RepID=A0A839IS34_9GAMM|nr:sigma-54-dependent Fis family transcriptional regulator [Oceanospirillum sediminis]MBB1487362.1 sigma-54-dependent Fis family transcriptional regulator [Oceanospirillum sediminis]
MNPIADNSDRSIDLARQHLLRDGQVSRQFLRSEIAHSWQRSVDAGLSCASPLEPENLSQSSLNDLKEQHRPLIEAAHPEIKQLAEYFSSVGGLVMLADADATILSVTGDKRHLDSQTRYALAEGASWCEEIRGTNALGTAVIDRSAVMINGNEHFLDSVGYLSCCSAPVTNAEGEVIGVLDLTSLVDNQKLPPNLSLVRQGVRAIENRMFSSRFRQQVILSVHSRPEYLRSSWQGMIALDLDGIIRAANDQLCQLLQRNRKELTGRSLERIFGIRPEQLLNDIRRKGRGVLRGLSGDFCCELLHFPDNQPLILPENRPARETKHRKADAGHKQSDELHSPNKALPELSEFAGQEPSLIKGVRMGSRALAHELPVLIQGETGTGKEVIARALRNDSRRRHQPFVAVNCAAIPEGLIESELFGYQEGAFTGSRKGGMTGRLQQANGGTLFLDEIGDMPLALQARLLRVLQERTIAPLGAGQEIALDIAVICASHRDLKQRVAEGLFREDLYYRLNGVCIRLPAFRNRADKASFIRGFLRQLTPDGQDISLDPELLHQLLIYPWPGNIRQLETTLRVAIAFMEPDESTITTEHLSDDFLDELSSRTAGTDKSSSETAVVQYADITQTTGLSSKAAEKEYERASRYHQSDLKAGEEGVIRQALMHHEGNISASARSLGISRATLYRKMRQYDLMRS